MSVHVASTESCVYVSRFYLRTNFWRPNAQRFGRRTVFRFVWKSPFQGSLVGFLPLAPVLFNTADFVDSEVSLIETMVY